MAYQSRQPCLPPPLNVPQVPTEAHERYGHHPLQEEPCAGQPAMSIPHQSKQPCLPPPACVQPCLVETPNPCVLTCVSSCNSSESYPAPPSVEASSFTGGLPTLSSCHPLPGDAQPCTAESAETHPPPCITLHDNNCPDASTVARRDTVLSYVLPGSIVSLDPHGSVTVKPGPSEAGETGETTDSIFVGSYTPHFF